MNVTEIFKKSFQDFKSPYFLGLSLLPFLVVLVLFGYLWFGFGGEWLAHAQASMDAGQVPFLDAQEHPWLTAILSFSLFKWLFTFFFYLVGLVAVVLFSVVIAAVVIGFFTPAIVKKIQKRHYPDFRLEGDKFTLMASIPYYLKTGIVFVLLGLVALPLMFIPAVNFVAIHIPFYYLFHNFMLLDVGSNILDPKRYRAIVKRYRGLFRTTTLTLYAISLIPVAGLFLQVYYVIVVAHEFFQKAIEEQG